MVGRPCDLGAEPVGRVLAAETRPLPGHEPKSPSAVHVVATVEPELTLVVAHLVVRLEQVHHEHLHLHCPAPRPHSPDEHGRTVQLLPKPDVLHQLELGLHKGCALLVHRPPSGLLAHVVDAPPLLLLLDHEEVRCQERVERDEVGHPQPPSLDLLLDAVDGMLLLLDEVLGVAVEHQLPSGVAAGGEAVHIRHEHVAIVVTLHVRQVAQADVVLAPPSPFQPHRCLPALAPTQVEDPPAGPELSLLVAQDERLNSRVSRFGVVTLRPRPALDLPDPLLDHGDSHLREHVSDVPEGDPRHARHAPSSRVVLVQEESLGDEVRGRWHGVCRLAHALHGHALQPFEVPHLLDDAPSQRSDQPRPRIVVHRAVTPRSSGGARVRDAVEQPVDGAHLVPSVRHGRFADDGCVAQRDRLALSHRSRPRDCVSLLLGVVLVEPPDLPDLPTRVCSVLLPGLKLDHVVVAGLVARVVQVVSDALVALPMRAQRPAGDHRLFEEAHQFGGTLLHAKEQGSGSRDAEAEVTGVDHPVLHGVPGVGERRQNVVEHVRTPRVLDDGAHLLVDELGDA